MYVYMYIYLYIHNSRLTIFSVHITYIVTRYIHNKNRVLQDKVYFY